MKKIRILQVVHRHDHAQQTFDSMMRLSDYIEVVGIADDNIEDAKKKINNAPAYYSIEEALKLDIDAVAIECEEECATKSRLCLPSVASTFIMTSPEVRMLLIFTD